MKSAYRKGVLLSVVTAVVSGVSVFVNKYAVGAITPPVVFTATKNFGVGLLILAWLLYSKKFKQIGLLGKAEVVKLLLVALVGGALPFYLFFTGLSQIPAINAALIHKSLVLWVALLAVPFLRERLSLVQVGAIALVTWANLAIGGFGGFEYSMGEIMVLGATVLWAVENVIAKKVLASVDPDLVTGARMGLGSVVLMGAALTQAPQAMMGVFSMTGQQMVWMLATAISLAVYVTSWYRALKLAPATLVATVLVGATVVTNVLSAIFVTRVWTGEMGVQALLIVVGLVVFVRGVMSEKQSETVSTIKVG